MFSLAIHFDNEKDIFLRVGSRNYARRRLLEGESL